MGVIYLISVLAVLITFIIVKKTEKEINIISFLGISIVALFCYNTFVCYVLTFFTIPITLLGLSLINIFFTCLLAVHTIKTKEIQKYKSNKLDFIYVLLIAIIALIVSYINFGFPFNVNYETGDPSVHYLTSVMFAESDSLLAGVENDEVYGSFSVRKTASYVNSGLIMKSFCNGLDFIECYNVFVAFGIFIFFLTGVSIYSAMRKFAKNNEHLFIAFIMSVLCMLGYPLNSFLFGFEYLSMGLLIICCIIDLVSYYKEDILNLKLFILIMALLNFGLFAAYYMFVPFVYPALWIYFCIENYFENKKFISKKLICILFITLLVPFTLGFIYHLAPEIYSVFINESLINMGTAMDYSEHIVNSGLAVNGYIYVNLYSNVLLLIPLAVYLFIKSAKDKKLKDNAFEGLLLLIAILFIEILLIGNKFGKVSMYYLSKNYFALWIILFYCNYKALILISEKNKIIPRILISLYVLLMIILTIFSNVKVEYYLNNPFETPLSVMEIYGANKTIMFEKPIDFNQKELEILKYARKNLDYNSEIEVVEDEQPNYWAYVLLRYINHEELTDQYYGQQKLNCKRYLLEENINKVDYMIYFNKSQKYAELKDKLFENSEIIYENEAGGILKYNK